MARMTPCHFADKMILLKLGFGSCSRSGGLNTLDLAHSIFVELIVTVGNYFLHVLGELFGGPTGSCTAGPSLLTGNKECQVVALAVLCFSRLSSNSQFFRFSS